MELSCAPPRGAPPFPPRHQSPTNRKAAFNICFGWQTAIEAELTIIPTDEYWKLTSMQLLEEEQVI